MHPVFDRIKDKKEFQKIVRRLAEGVSYVKDRTPD